MENIVDNMGSVDNKDDNIPHIQDTLGMKDMLDNTHKDDKHNQTAQQSVRQLPNSIPKKLQMPTRCFSYFSFVFISCLFYITLTNIKLLLGTIITNMCHYTFTCQQKISFAGVFTLFTAYSLSPKTFTLIVS